jgi:hypothetical protein
VLISKLSSCRSVQHIRTTVSIYSFSLCVSFCSLQENDMDEEAEAAIKAAWAPRFLSALEM